LVDTSHGGANLITSALTPASATSAKISSSNPASLRLQRDERFIAGLELWPIFRRIPDVHQLLHGSGEPSIDYIRRAVAG
jgi:hypothetical protein